jgi:hypothetical protein
MEVRTKFSGQLPATAAAKPQYIGAGASEDGGTPRPPTYLNKGLTRETMKTKGV